MENQKIYLDELIEFHYTPQAKALLYCLLAKEFIYKRIDDMVILDVKQEKEPTFLPKPNNGEKVIKP